MFVSDLRALHESYQGIYEEGDGISHEMLEEVVEELIQECVEFGYTLDEATVAVENAAILYIDEAKITYGSDTESPEQRRERAKTKVGEKKAAARKAVVKGAVKRVKDTAMGVKAAAGIGASIAKDEARRAGRKAAHAVSSTVRKKKEEVKTGVKSLIGRGLRKAAGAVGKVAQKAAGAASRLGEGVRIDEVLDTPEKANEYAKKNVRSMLGAFAKGVVNKDISQLKTIEKRKRGAELGKRKAERKVAGEQNEELQVDTWDVVLEYLITNGHADTNSEALYIMSQLDEEMVQSIVEAQHARENPERYEREQRSKETRGQSAERRVRDRLRTMDPAKAEKMKAQMRAVGLNV